MEDGIDSGIGHISRDLLPPSNSFYYFSLLRCWGWGPGLWLCLLPPPQIFWKEDETHAPPLLGDGGYYWWWPQGLAGRYHASLCTISFRT